MKSKINLRRPRDHGKNHKIFANKFTSSSIVAEDFGNYSGDLTPPVGVIYENNTKIYEFLTLPLSTHFDRGAVVGTTTLILLFWGDFWLTATDPSVPVIRSAVSHIIDSPYLTELSQYGFQSLVLGDSYTVHEPGASYPTFSGDNVTNMVWDLIDNGTFP